MFERRHAKAVHRPLLTISTEPTSPFHWANDEMKELCELSSKMYVNLGQLAQANWEADEGPTPAMLADLSTQLGEVVRLLELLGCRPAMH